MKFLLVSSAFVLLLFAVACGRDGEATTLTAAADLSDLGACNESGEVDFAPADRFIENAVEWLEVEPSGAETSRALTDSPRDATAEVAMSVRPVTAGAATSSAGFAPRNVRIHGSLLEGVAWARATDDARVFAGVGGTDYGGRIIFLLVVAADGQFAFAGNCQSEALTQPLLNRFDGDPRRIRDVIGRVGADLTAALTEPGATPAAAPHPVVLHPDEVDQALLDSLSLASVEVHIPPTWAAPATLCSRIEEGWNDCLPLDGSLSYPRNLTMYVADSGTVDLWLMNEHADLTQPLQRLGTITVPDSSMAPGAAPLVVEVSGDLADDGRTVTSPTVATSGG